MATQLSKTEDTRVEENQGGRLSDGGSMDLVLLEKTKLGVYLP